MCGNLSTDAHALKNHQLTKGDFTSSITHLSVCDRILDLEVTPHCAMNEVTDWLWRDDESILIANELIHVYRIIDSSSGRGRRFPDQLLR